MSIGHANLVVWDVDGTLIPADLRWLRRAIALTYNITESQVTFPEKKVHGYTDESIAVDTAIASGISPGDAEAGIAAFRSNLSTVMSRGTQELAEAQPPYPGAADSIAALHSLGYAQTVLTGNLRSAAEVKLTTAGLSDYLDLRIGGFGSDDRDRFRLPGVIAERFARTYGHPLDPRRVVVVGDAPNDIACAKQANFRVVVVTHRATREELSIFGPDAIVDSLDPDTLVGIIGTLLSGSSD